MTSLSARADGRRTKSAKGRNREAVERLQCSGLHEGLIETRTLMRTEGAYSDQVDGAFKRAMPLRNRRAPHATRTCWHKS
jgi:hypothetical protein